MRNLLLLAVLSCNSLVDAFSPPIPLYWQSAITSAPRSCTHHRQAVAPKLRNGAASLRASTDNAAFVSWLDENGVKSSCSLAEDGFVASSPLKASAEACTSSPKVYLTEATAKEALGPKIDELDAETAIALQLLLEKSKGSESFWAPWIATLPEADALNVPLFWSDTEKKFLEGSTVEEEADKLTEALEDEFKQLQAEGWGDTFPDNTFTLENYIWAVCTTCARSVSFEKFPGKTLIAPPIDTALTSTPGSGVVSLGFEGMFREPRIKISLSEGVTAGEAVGVDFDGKSSSSLLLRHGVARTAGGVGEVEVQFQISPLDRFADDKLDILEINGYASEQTFVLRSDDAPPPLLMAFMRLVCIKATDAFLLESVFRNEVWDFMQDPVSPENEELVLDTLIATFEGSLETLLDADPIPAGPDASQRAILAQTVRESEMRALRTAILFLEEDKKSLEQKEYYQERRLRSLNLDRPVDESEVVDPDVDIRRENVPWN